MVDVFFRTHLYFFLVHILAFTPFYAFTKTNSEIIVEASVDSSQTQADYAIKGLLTITHPQNEKVDVQSVSLQGQPVQISLIQETPMTVSSNLAVSIYQFELPAQKKGFYQLPSFSLKVGNVTYQSLPSSYSVRGAEEKSVSPSASSPPVFVLKAKVDGETTLYPGQRTKLVYQIVFDRDIDLTRSDLPFISSSAFHKIGDVHIQDSQQGELTIQELIQEIEAVQIGRFSFGPAFIEGYAYTLQGKQKIYDSKRLYAAVSSLSLEVIPFPSLKKPLSFTGALGRIEIDRTLLSSSSVEVGDRILLQVQIEGVNSLREFSLPSFLCQPGFSGFFQIAELPLKSEIKGTKKVFFLELRPLTSLVDQVPSIEVSSFDPEKGDYHVVHTSPIPLHVRPFRLPLNPLPQMVFPLPLFGEWPSPPLPPLALPIDVVSIDQEKESVLKEANAFYEKGGAALTFEERKIFFNQALFLYHLVEKNSSFSDLYRGLGDLYFQLGEYPWAVLFYERSLKKNPYSSLALSHLKKAQHLLGLFESPGQAFSFSFFHAVLFFIGVLFIFFLFYVKRVGIPFSFLNKQKKTIWEIYLQQVPKIGIILFAFFFCYLLVSEFSSSVEGILIKPTALYSFPDRQQPRLALPPLMPGSKVEILQVVKKGEWLKIRNQEGWIGYVPAEPIRLIY